MLERILNCVEMPSTSISPSELSPLLSAWKSQALTGLVACNLQSGGLLYLLLVRGNLIFAHHPMVDFPVLQVESWTQKLERLGNKIDYRFLALTPQTMRLFRLLLDHSKVDSSLKIEGNQRLRDYFQKVSIRKAPSLIMFDWSDAVGMALLPGLGLHPSHTLFISDNQIFHTSGNMMALLGWRTSICQVKTLYLDDELPAWQEYGLSIAFTELIRHLLSEYKEYSESRELGVIAQEINFLCSANGWHANLTKSGFSSQMVFSSPEQGVWVYQRIYNELVQRFAGVLGEKNVHQLSQSALNHLDGKHKSWLTQWLDLDVPEESSFTRPVYLESNTLRLR